MKIDGQINPYLFFGGQCEEAIEFYKQALGAQVGMMMKFSESPDPIPQEFQFPGYEDKIMHAGIKIGGTEVMMSDGCEPGSTFGGFALSLTLPDEASVRKAFEALADGGKVDMPVGPTFWSPSFGMVTDKFGIQWMLTVPDAPPAEQ